MIITNKQLKSGLVVETTKRMVHKRFSVWSMNEDNTLWCRLREGFGPISGWKSTDDLLLFLQRHNFYVVGYYELIEDRRTNQFVLRGAL